VASAASPGCAAKKSPAAEALRFLASWVAPTPNDRVGDSIT